MTSTPVRGTAELSFSRAEAWVVHDALRAAVRGAAESDEPLEPEVDLLRSIEAGEEQFSHGETEVVRDALVSYLTDAPLRDQKPGRDAIRRIRSELR
ncbi:MAG: hypothetical protein ABEI99_09710 [Halobaculum sp.]